MTHPLATHAPGATPRTSPRLFIFRVAALLRVEAALAFVAALAAYDRFGGSWLLFFILFLTPDVAMIGYVAGPRIGAALYNASHSYLGPAALCGIGWWVAAPLLTALALVWAAHIAFDRVLGYGLKRATSFHDTHLGRIGRAG